MAARKASDSRHARGSWCDGSERWSSSWLGVSVRQSCSSDDWDAMTICILANTVEVEFAGPVF